MSRDKTPRSNIEVELPGLDEAIEKVKEFAKESFAQNTKLSVVRLYLSPNGSGVNLVATARQIRADD